MINEPQTNSTNGSSKDLEMLHVTEIDGLNPIEDRQTLEATLFHTKSVPDAIRVLNSHKTKGLTELEAQRRLLIYGKNEITSDDGIKWYKILLHQVINPMTAILVVGLILSLVGSEWVEGGVLLFVIVTNATIGFRQDYSSEKTMESLRKMASPTARVLRDTTISYISALDVVPGDIILFEEGDVIPADGRIIECFHLEVDEALLTGESLPVQKDTSVIPNPEEPIGDRVNLVYGTTIVTKGRGKALVHRTGFGTEMGKIATEIEKAGKAQKSGTGVTKTNLEKTLDYLAYFLFALVAVLAFIVFAANEFKWSKEVAGYALSVVIAVLPEGLTAVITITMAYGVKKMAKQKAIVRKRMALESLGAITDICTDKTGTLTQGKMVLTKIYIPATGIFSVSGEGYKPTGVVSKVEDVDTKEGGTPIVFPQIPKGLFHFTRCGSLCNMAVIKRKGVTSEAEKEHAIHPEVPLSLASHTNAEAFSDALKKNNKEWHEVAIEELEKTSPNDWEAIGDPTEVALQAFGWKLQLGKPHLASVSTKTAPYSLDILQEFAFDATLKLMSVIYRESDLKGEKLKFWVFAKGAFESIFSRCCGVVSESGNDIKFDNQESRDEVAKKSSQMIDLFASKGLRVLALAYRQLPENLTAQELEKWDRETTESELIFLGLAGIYDPPREESKSAVAECRNAGIQVHMLTGDHPKTAFSIAKEVDIIPSDLDENNPNFSEFVMVATDFDRLSDEDVDRMVQLPKVLARCSPLTKVKVVDSLLRRQRIVAMTGDGTNDAPSLKKANVGIAMGMNGSDVAKQASDIVLTDDNFATIVKAVAEGRRIFVNIQKFVLHLMSVNVAEIIALIIGLVFRDANGETVYPMSPVQILFLNMVTSSPPAMGLGMDHASDDIMENKPRNPKKSARALFTNEVITDISYYGTFMGGIVLAVWCAILYNPQAMQATQNNPLGFDCNSSQPGGGVPPQCEYVFRARATTFMCLTSMILIHAFTCRSLQKSIIWNSPFAGIKNWYSNRFLFWSVVFGYVVTIAVIYIPGLNTDGFKQAPITWEWALVVGSNILFLFLTEIYKLIKRTYFPHKKGADLKG